MVLMSVFTKVATILVTFLQSLYPWNAWGGVCNSPECRTTAYRIIVDSNPDVNPCDNFYQFVCGNFMAGKDLHGRIATHLGSMQGEVNYQIKSFLQEKPKRREPRVFSSVKRLYQMCMDENKMDSRGAAPGVAMLEKLGGWPMLGNWDPTKWNFLETEIRASQLGLEGYSLIEVGIGIDFADRTKHVLTVNPTGMSISRKYLIEGEDNSVVKEYFQYMVDMAMLFDVNSQTAEKAMRKVLQFQIEIAKILSSKDDDDGTPKQVTLKELDEDPNKLLDWRKLFEGMLSPIKLQDDLKIDIYNLEVIKKILALINIYPAEIVANYVMWNFAIPMSNYLTTAMRNLNHRFKQVVEGNYDRSPRWRECMKEVNGLVLSAVYVNKFFDKSSRNKAKDVTNRIQNEMDEALLEADWMDEKTREKAQRKSANILHVVGYPDELADMTKVEEYYKEFNLNKEHLFEARLDWNVFFTRKEVKKLNEVSVKRPWEAHSTITTTNAFYGKSMNSIVVSAAFLQDPFFSASVPSYLNYAGIGYVIGHEITHAFDNEGRMFDHEGEMNEWWDEASLNKFNKKKQCLIDQYSSFTESVTKRKVNGISTQGENIADNGGLKLAYRAYRRVADQLKKPEPGLPGLKDYNNDQLFFIRFANNWCSVIPSEKIEHDMMTGQHAPAEWRVNGVVMNMPQFGKLFECDKGTPMNPTEKCEVW